MVAGDTAAASASAAAAARGRGAADGSSTVPDLSFSHGQHEFKVPASLHGQLFVHQVCSHVHMRCHFRHVLT